MVVFQVVNSKLSFVVLPGSPANDCGGYVESRLAGIRDTAVPCNTLFEKKASRAEVLGYLDMECW